MKKRWIHLMMGLIALIVFWAIPSLVMGNGKDDEVKMAADAKVSIDQAIKVATDTVPGKAIKAYLEEEHDTTVWEVYVLTPEKKLKEIHIDAKSGNVIDIEEEDDKD